MIISTNWLSEYVRHDLEVDDLADLLTMCGLEVEEVVQIGSSLDGVVIGHVQSVQSHPDADRLRLCMVDVGASEPLTIVCGAPNVEAGQKVAVAKVGAVLKMPSRENPDEKISVTIRKSKIRGQISYGMICSEVELGVGLDSTGILVLDSDAPVGEPVSQWLAERGETTLDHVLDIAITPNRPDAVCHVGVARDVAAVTGKELVLPNVSVPEHGGQAAEAFSVKIKATGACHEYVGILVRDVEVSESPRWLQQRLLAVGLRPRNNIVDITNFVMYELGQPLHAFDFDALSGSTIEVHETEREIKFVTLDGKERTLPRGTLMIADGERDIAIAGIMGGENSEVSERTTSILIESAWFDPSHIRRTAKSLQLQTDASYRFERGVDPCSQALAAARAAELIVSLAGGTRVSGMVSARSEPVQKKLVSLRRSRANLIIGVEISSEIIFRLLEAIGFEVKSDDDELFECVVPSFRPDIDREIDIIEELARLYGFDKIPEPVRSSVPDHSIEISAQRHLRGVVRNRLAANGYREIYTNSMLRRETAEKYLSDVLPGGQFGGEIVETLNPISQEMAALRPSLLPGVLAIAGYNANHGRKSLRYFEFGNIQIRADTPDSIVAGYTERETLLILCSGDDTAPDWYKKTRHMDFFDLKGIAEAVLSDVRLPDIQLTPASAPSSIFSSHTVVMSGDEYVGVLGKLSGVIQDRYDLPASVYFMELDWTRLSTFSEPGLRRRYTPFSRYPVVERDLAISVARNTSVGSLLDLIRKTGAPLLSHASVFDLYEGEQIVGDKKSVAFSLTFSANRTLIDKEVDENFEAIVKALESNSGAQLRQ